MKLKLLLAAILITSSLASTAQMASKTYAITGKTNNNFFWADIKQVDITTGKISKTLFDSETTAFKVNNADNTVVNLKTVDNNPTGLGVAACAFDSRHNRLYFATMHFSDIRYLDLNKGEANFTTIRKTAIAKPAGAAYQNEENHITRMVIAADGYGYALSNDANHLLRFSTSKNPVVEDLGNLIDAETNTNVSIHNKCTSWGGDMVAGAFGELVVVSANRHVFKVDVKNRVASLAGIISGLPANFTTNGAAVDDDGNLVVSSANVFEGLYKVSMKDLAAVKIQTNQPAFNASDLANGNLLYQKEANDISRYNPIKNVFPAITDEARIYPNPVSAAQFNVVFEGQPSGKYTIVLTDIAGKSLQSKVVNISKAGQVESFRFTGRTAKGVYLVKVLSEKRQLAFSEKIIVN